MNGQNVAVFWSFKALKWFIVAYKMVSTNPGPQVLHNIAILQQMLISFNSSETAIWSLVWDGFNVKGQDGNPWTLS